MNKCLCGNILQINAGDCLQENIYRWYASCHCAKCGESIEIDGCEINTIPAEIKRIIIEKEGEWGIKSLTSKIKMKYILNKYIPLEKDDIHEEYYYIGTQNQVEWIKIILIKKGISESELLLEKI